MISKTLFYFWFLVTTTFVSNAYGMNNNIHLEENKKIVALLKIKYLLLTAIIILYAMPNFAGNADSSYRKAGNFIFISSQVPINPTTHQLVSNDIRQQVKQVLDNLRKQIIESGANINDVVKIDVYMDDIDLILPIVNEYIPQYFDAPYPARSPMGGLSFGKTGFKIAIDAILYTR